VALKERGGEERLGQGGGGERIGVVLEDVWC